MTTGEQAQAITGKKYMLSAIRRKHLDRIPVTALIGPYCSRLTGRSVREILQDAKKSAEAHLAFYERFQPDSLIIYNDIYLELEALGSELEFPADDISHPKKAILERKSDLARLAIPDPQRDGRLPYFLEVCERVAGPVRKTASVGLGHSGPWNLAMHLRGAEQCLMDTFDHPDYVHELMDFTTRVVQTFGDALFKLGFMPSLGEASASCSLISPHVYRTFIQPYHQRLCEHFKSHGGMMSLHICGLIDPIIDDVLSTGIGLLSLDAPSSLAEVVARAQGRVVIMGNVATGLFAEGAPEEMENAVDQCLQTAAAGSGYILASGCEIPLNSTEDRVAHFFGYAKQAGARFVSQIKQNQA